MTPSIIILFTGFALLAISAISFRIRALLNKKAWQGATLPFLWTGLLATAIGLIMLLLTYE